MLPDRIQIADLVKVEHGETMTTSLKVAEVFGKSHKNVLRDIASLECSAGFRELNFELSSFSVKTGNGTIREYPCYNMTKDGFMFLVMGFIGEKAAAFKEAYIDEFNRNEKIIKSIAENMLLAASDRAQQALIGTVRSQEAELASARAETRRLKSVAEKSTPVSDFGSLSPKNGLPRSIFRRPTFAVPPEPAAIVITQGLVDQFQLLLDLQQSQGRE